MAGDREVTVLIWVKLRVESSPQPVSLMSRPIPLPRFFFFLPLIFLFFHYSHQALGYLDAFISPNLSKLVPQSNFFQFAFFTRANKSCAPLNY